MSSIALAVSFISIVTWQRPASASTDINADKLVEFFVEKVEGVRAATSNVLPPSNVRYNTSPELLSSFHWWSATTLTRSAVKSSALDRNSEGRRLKIGEWRQRSYAPLWKISGYATEKKKLQRTNASAQYVRFKSIPLVQQVANLHVVIDLSGCQLVGNPTKLRTSCQLVRNPVANPGWQL